MEMKPFFGEKPHFHYGGFRLFRLSQRPGCDRAMQREGIRFGKTRLDLVGGNRGCRLRDQAPQCGNAAAHGFVSEAAEIFRWDMPDTRHYFVIKIEQDIANHDHSFADPPAAYSGDSPAIDLDFVPVAYISRQAQLPQD